MNYECLKQPDYTATGNLEILKRLSAVNPPKDILRVLSPDDFEDFIEEWAYYTLQEADSNQYARVYKLGGTGDKGRDILAFTKQNPEELDIYQCKHYSNALSPADIKKEVIKICYYTYIQDFNWPKNYFFIATNDLTSDAEMLLTNPDLLKETILKEWDKIVKQVIRNQKKKIDMVPELKKYINEANFTVFKFIPILKIIDEYLKTPLAPFRFGKSHLKPRPTAQLPTKHIEEREGRYTEQLFKVYKVKKEEELKGAYENHFKRQRNHFFEAESLKIYEEEVSLPGKNDFNIIKKRILDHIIDIHDFQDFDRDFDKVLEVTKEARKVQLGKENYLIGEYVEDNDKHGICHHLVNEKKIYWCAGEES